MIKVKPKVKVNKAQHAALREQQHVTSIRSQAETISKLQSENKTLKEKIAELEAAAIPVVSAEAAVAK